MENQIAILIACYQAEKDSLQNLITKCIENTDGPDYISANYHQVALDQIQHTLRILQNLDDELFDEKALALRSISFLEKLSKNSDSTHVALHLQHAKNKLAYLKSIPKKIIDDSKENTLEKALADLVTKKIRRFKLILNNSEDLHLQFFARGNSVSIVLPNLKRHIKEGNLDCSQIIQFQSNGFELPTNNKLVKTLPNKGTVTLDQLKFILVKTFFKIFDYKCFQKDCYIELY